MIIPEKVGKEIDNAYKMLAEANKLDHHIWFEHVFLSWQWCLQVVLIIFIWGLWWILRKKESTNRLLVGGFYMMFVSMFLDSIGSELGLWDYRFETIPLLPSFVLWDLTLIPVFFLALAQYKPKLSPWIKGLFFAAFTSFVGEPIFEWLGYYESEHWKSIYSFPIFFILYLIGHYLIMSKNFDPL